MSQDGQRWTEQVLLNCLLYDKPGDADTVWSICDPSMFTPGPYQNAAGTLHSWWEKGIKPDAPRLVAEWAGVPASGIDAPFVADLIASHIIGDPGFHAEALVRSEIARTVTATATRLAQQVEGGADPADVAADGAAALLAASQLLKAREDSAWSYEEVLDMATQPVTWRIPQVLAAGERLVLTGGEGMGKSTLMAQIGLGAGWGVNPFNSHERFDPVDVLVLDVENSHDTQLAPIWRKLDNAYRAMGSERGQIRLMKIKDVDLFDKREQASVVRDIVQKAPGLLLMGAGYKLVSVTDDWKIAARSIQGTIDRVRAAVGCSVILETHAGHGTQNDRNNGRPEGSADWLRWPEFGFWLKTVDRDRRLVKIDQWRGDRVTGRSWPAGFIGGGLLPFTAISSDEWEARYEDR